MAINEWQDEDLVAELQRRGFEVKKKIQYVKQGVEVDVVIFEHFKAYCKKQKIKLKIAISEAIKDWLLAHLETNTRSNKRSSNATNAS